MWETTFMRTITTGAGIPIITSAWAGVWVTIPGMILSTIPGTAPGTTVAGTGTDPITDGTAGTVPGITAAGTVPGITEDGMIPGITDTVAITVVDTHTGSMTVITVA